MSIDVILSNAYP